MSIGYINYDNNILKVISYDKIYETFYKIMITSKFKILKIISKDFIEVESILIKYDNRFGVKDSLIYVNDMFDFFDSYIKICDSIEEAYFLDDMIEIFHLNILEILKKITNKLKKIYGMQSKYIDININKNKIKLYYNSGSIEGMFVFMFEGIRISNIIVVNGQL